jgi:hypothetical protein
VRSGPFWPIDPSTDFQTPDGKPNTVLDTYWGYMWQKADSGTSLTWAQANAYCDGLDLDGYTDWRLPEMAALLTIVNYTTYYPALSTIFDQRRSDPPYWSSSTLAGTPTLGGAWGVDFGVGYAGWGDKSYGYYVRCVRSGPG